MLYAFIVVSVIVVCIFVFAPREKIPRPVQIVLIAAPIILFAIWLLGVLKIYVP